jgi:acyl-CoA synthetase (NDP forming)
MRLTQNDLDKFFNPKSIALVGVSRSGWKFGGLSFLRKYLQAGYKGNLYPINPKADEILGVTAWPDLSALPEVPDLGVVAVAAAHIPKIIETCGRIGLHHLHLLTSGYAETGTKEGRKLEAQLIAEAEKHGVLLIGPNCMGPYCPTSHMTAWGAIPGIPGPLGIISQSGGMTQRLTEYTASLGLGVAKAVSVGNGCVLDTLDFLEAFGKDPSIGTIGLYLESVKDGRRLLRVAGEVGLKKPIVLLKGGQSAAGARTALSHTGALAGNHLLWKAVARQANMIPVRNGDEWADTLMALSFIPEPSTDGVFIIGGGGGSSVVYGDTCIREGLKVPQLAPDIMEHLRKVTPVAGSIAGNPLDLWLTFSDPAFLAEIIDLVDKDPSVGMILADRLIARAAFHMPDEPDPTPATLAQLKKRTGQKPIVFVVDAEGGDSELAAQGASVRAAYGAAGYAAYPTIDRAAKALTRICRYYRKRAAAA